MVICEPTSVRFKDHPMDDAEQGVIPEGQLLKCGGPVEDMNLCGPTPSFRWSRDVVRRLDEEAQWALALNPTGAAEIVGILLGKKGPNLEITDCEPVFLMDPQDHARTLTGRGKREFERAIPAIKSLPEHGLSVIGLYRSHIGPGLDLTEEDFNLLRTCFRDTSQITLLMQLTDVGSTRVRLFLGDSSQPLCETHASENKLCAVPRWLVLWHNLSAKGLANTAEPATITSADGMPRGRRQIEALPTREAGQVQEGSATSVRRWKRFPLFFLIAATLLAVIGAYPLFQGSARVNHETNAPKRAALHPDSRSSQQSTLAFWEERHGDYVRLKWDPTARMLVAASGGILVIRSGDAKERQVLLDGGILRTGGLLYGPVHDDTSLRIIIFDKAGKKLGESTQQIYPARSR